MRTSGQRFARRLSRAAPLRNTSFLITLGLLVSGLAAGLTYLNEYANQQRLFEQGAFQRLDALDRRIGEGEAALEPIASALAHMESITLSDFRELVDPLLANTGALEFIAWFPTDSDSRRPLAVQPASAMARANEIPERLLADATAPTSRRSGMTWGNGENRQALVLVVRPVAAVNGILIGAFDLRGLARPAVEPPAVRLHVFDLAGAATPVAGPHRRVEAGAETDYRLSDLRRHPHFSRAVPIADLPWVALAEPVRSLHRQPRIAALWVVLVGILITLGIAGWARATPTRPAARHSSRHASEPPDRNRSSAWQLAPERLRHLIDDSPEIVTQISATGKVQYVSPATREILDTDPSMLMGRSFFDLLHPDDALRARQAQLQALTRPGVYSAHYRLRCSGGRYRWLDCIVRVITDPNTGEATGFIGIGRDGVRRHQEVQRLRDQEALYRSVFDSSPQPTVVLTVDGTRVFRVNQAFCNMLGYSKPELRALRAQDVTHPADHTRSLRAAARAHMSYQQRVRFETRYLRKDGTTVWTVVDMGLVREINGSPHYLVCHIVDITAQRAGQRELPGFGQTHSVNTADA